MTNLVLFHEGMDVIVSVDGVPVSSKAVKLSEAVGLIESILSTDQNATITIQRAKESDC